MDNQKIKIDAQLAQAILDYLISRPYREVYQLIAALMAAAQAQADGDEPE